MLLEILIFVTLASILDVLARVYATRNLINVPLVSKIPFFGSIMTLATITPDSKISESYLQFFIKKSNKFFFFF